MTPSQYAQTMLGLPYRYGGDNPLIGFDCSGVVVEILKAFGRLAHRADSSAQGLYVQYRSSFAALGDNVPADCIVFYGKKLTEITHCGWSIGNQMMIEAGGGDSTTTTREQAEKQKAWVRPRPIGYRADYIGYAKVF